MCPKEMGLKHKRTKNRTRINQQTRSQEIMKWLEFLQPQKKKFLGIRLSDFTTSLRIKTPKILQNRPLGTDLQKLTRNMNRLFRPQNRPLVFKICSVKAMDSTFCLEEFRNGWKPISFRTKSRQITSIMCSLLVNFSLLSTKMIQDPAMCRKLQFLWLLWDFLKIRHLSRKLWFR